MIQYILKWAVSLGLFAWWLWNGEIQFQSFQQLARHRGYLAGVLGTQAALFVLAALRWRMLARAFLMEVSFFKFLKFFLMERIFLSLLSGCPRRGSLPHDVSWRSRAATQAGRSGDRHPR